MPDCLTLVRLLVPPNGGDLVQRPEIAAACVQWEATLLAGYKQAEAARFAGQMTIWAGIFALTAALLAAFVAYKGIHIQLNAERKRQREELEHVAKREVALVVAPAVFAGLMAIARLADLQLSTDQCLQDYQNRAPDISRLHVVASASTIRLVLAAVNYISKVHQELIVARRRFNGMSIEQKSHHQLNWGRVCLARLPELTPLMTAAITAMRADLNFDIKQEDYRKIVEEATALAMLQATKTFDEVEHN